MEANLLGGELPAPALRQPAHAERDQQPRIQGQEQDDQQADVEPLGSGGSLIERNGGWQSQRASQLIHRTGTLLLVAGVGVTQLAWMAVLAYGTYSIWEWLPF
jgi:hypothetical protein